MNINDTLWTIRRAPIRTLGELAAMHAALAGRVDEFHRANPTLDLAEYENALSDAEAALEKVTLADPVERAREAAGEWNFEDRRTEAKV